MRLGKRVWSGLLIAVALAAGAWVLWLRQEAATASDAGADAPPRVSWWASQMPHGAPTPGTEPQPHGMPPETVVTPPNPLDTVRPPVFRATATGNLVIDPQTRTDVERLYALYAHDGAQQKLDAFSANLPEAARRDLRDLYQHWAQYAQALAQAIPPEQSTDTLQEARRQLGILKDLRQQYFGAEQAQAMFGQEEALTEDMLNRIAANKDPKMTFDEKVNDAQNKALQAAGAGNTPP